MHCPVCGADDTKVVDSRLAEEGAAVRRRRRCLACEHRFTTYERLEELPLLIHKTDGSTEPFERDKLRGGIAAALKGRPVPDDAVDSLVTRIEDGARLSAGPLSSAQIGVSVLDGLRGLDEVAYLRFASVYKDFDAASDFQSELDLLQKAART